MFSVHQLQELFYLLADAEHDAIEQGGVVTVSSLAVELQAGMYAKYMASMTSNNFRSIIIMHMTSLTLTFLPPSPSLPPLC